MADAGALSPEARAALMRLPALTVEDAAAILDIPASTLDGLLLAGNGPAVFRIGRRRMVRPADLAAWCDLLAETHA